MNLGTLIATLGVDATGLYRAEQQMKAFETRAQASMARTSRSLATAGKSMKQFGRSMSMYVTLPLTLLGGKAVMAFSEVEASMSKMIGLVGVNRDVVEQWGKELKYVADESSVGVKELSDAMYFITSAGIRGAEAMNVLEASARASAAGLGETKVVADLVTSAVNAYGIANLSAAEATDILTAAVREGKLEADVLASTMGMVLPVASYMGVAFNEVGAAIAAMSRTGTSAQTASMQLRQMLNSLLKPTQQAEEALRLMGTSGNELRKTIREKGLLTALMKVRELTSTYGEEIMAKVFPNIRALAGVLDMMGSNLEDNIKIFKSLENATGSADKAFLEASKTLKFMRNTAVANFQSALEGLGGSIKEVFLPVLVRLSEWFLRIAERTEKLTEQQRRWRVIIGTVTAAIGPLSVVLGFLVGNILPGLIKVGMATIRMFKLLRIVMLANPIMLIATVVSIAAAAFVTFNRRIGTTIKEQKKLNEVADDYNKILEEGIRLRETGLVEEKMAEIASMNQRQLRDIKSQLQNRIETEEDFSIKLKSEWDKRLKEEQYYADLALDQTIENTRKIRQWQRDTKGWKENLIEQKRQNEQRLNQLRSYLDQVLQLIKEDNDKIKISLGEIKMILKEVSDEAIYAEKIHELLGDTFDKNTHMINAYSEAIDKLIRGELDIADERVQDLARSMKYLMSQMTLAGLLADEAAIGKSIEADADAARDAMIAMVEGTTESLDLLSNTTESTAEVIGNSMMNVACSFSTLGDAIAQASEDSRTSFAEAMNIIAKTATTTISVLGALAAAEIIAKEAAKGVIGILTAIAGLATLAAVWATFVKPNKYEPMAEGAIVTRPTRALIGERGPEAVIPLDEMMPINNVNIHVTIEGVARGEDIHYVVKEIERKHENSYG